MALQQSLRSHTPRDTVNNVVLFIADAVRLDSLPEEVKDFGVSAKGIAASTFTGSSIPSIVSGKYPSTHKVWSFGDSLSTLPTLFSVLPNHSFHFNDEFHLRPSTIGTPERIPLSDLSEPFVYVYHDRGGHLPYGREFEEYDDMREYFQDINDLGKLQELYKLSVANSAKRFRTLIKRLEDRGILNQTLVIFTSDHGELLGEYGGLVNHSVPMVPELVHVPVVFGGAGLSSGERFNSVVSGVDLTPTLLGALSKSISKDIDGYNLWNSSPPSDRAVRSEVWKHTRYDYLTSYTASGVWDYSGGHVFNMGSRYRHLIYALGVHLFKGPHAPITRSISPRKNLEMLRPHVRRSLKYGTPEIASSTAKRTIPAFTEGSESNRYEPNHDRLRQLGYLE